MIVLLLSILLSVSASVGLSPLHLSAKVSLDPTFAAGTVCLLWDSPDETATSGSDCWTVENSRQRTWVKDLTLRTGVYQVWVTEVGQDTQGHAMKATSPGRRVEVY